MAYIIMCVESFLTQKYPDIDWIILANAMWKATNTNWGDWTEFYAAYIPSVLYEYPVYTEELTSSYTEAEYNALLALYSGITDGDDDNPTDYVNRMISLPYELAMAYEGTNIANGQASFDLIAIAESILISHNYQLPDYSKVLFSSVEELNGWGNDFKGEFLSIVIK